MKRGLFKFKLLATVVLVILIIAGGWPLWKQRHYQVPLVLGPGVTEVKKLSDFFPAIRGSQADTRVYVLEGKEPGGRALIMGNTHSNEPEGLLSVLIMIENAVVEKGTLYLIPYFNHSGSLNTRPGEGYPLYFSVSTPWGQKTFRMGNRDASPLDQWPDPDVYIHYPEKQLLSYLDIRNTNRTWPGRKNGLPMEQVTYAAMELLRQNQVDLAIDLHGAETMFPVTNCIVAPEKAIRLATLASLTVKSMEGFENHVEPSPVKFRGLSHREIGDYSDTLPFLLEAPMPFLDQPTGPKTEKLFLTGQDDFLLSLAKKKKLFVPYDESGWPLEKRVGQHLSVSLEIIRQYSRKTPERAIVIQNIPRYRDVVQNGVGYYFHNPAEAEPGKIILD
ncbi:MAG TPA: succinylglutamate desuccinylase [Candidatus Saccharicenans sp.]|nr:succinylglutamate desuccinylase [Candidatus Saccharicenans sp.]HQE64929.1 succinylglutamate desuccinylase [Candidatus Saccharicenans sp.]HQH60290.1 succinylglutamate desuccinylase [Candidatus Saccharicenans sp.]HQI21619.1 succinylglutamate desuccinylase [Candidatus Saccharicenans sp.]